ncbi:Oidioi.mRNA.OKI2018_I69.PAR.g10279.t1.cds [Oikopleura dioica]|uniref:Oidioi.mRNA.OKI2018_I69.PAR.g10279.t1.cds n=1 Tax=Oikopleura dioica TaxID=34765 RepID=A0ABN7RPX7_OIKDI|nr:Oidioi.mRNA.OKI2018_I69.PAR.g10279.t1.cds [Oikopleura dioica]
MWKAVFFLPQIWAQTQPDAWPDYQGSYGLYGVWSRPSDVQWSDFVQFYHSYDATKTNPKKVMSRKIHGAYVTALWDKPNEKVHLLHDEFDCTTRAWQNEPEFELNGEKYQFIPPLSLISKNRVEGITKVKTNETVRGIPVWKWKADLKDSSSKSTGSIEVITAQTSSENIPLRPMRLSFRLPGVDHHEIFEIFKFRWEEPPVEVFQIPALTPCKTSHKPEIPVFKSKNFHAMAEIKDIIYGSEKYDFPIYDFDITYSQDVQLSKYRFSTNGFADMISFFGKTQLECTNDYEGDVVYCTDLLYGNCSSWSLSDDSFPGSSTTIHGGLVSMKSPAEFWGTDDPQAYWFKGNSTVRNVLANSWTAEKTVDKKEYTFDWYFSDSSWKFYTHQESRRQQPLLLRTRSADPVTPDGHHHHVDYSIYYYDEGLKSFPANAFDSASKCFAGEKHSFLQINMTDVDGTGPDVVRDMFKIEFEKRLRETLARAAGVGFLRINRLKIFNFDQADKFQIQFYLLEKSKLSKSNELTLDEAKFKLSGIIGSGGVGMHLNMAEYLGYDSRFQAINTTLITKELFDENVIYQDKYVTDGVSDGNFAVASILTIVGGVAIGLAAVSSVFQIAILGIVVPKI